MLRSELKERHDIAHEFFTTYGKCFRDKKTTLSLDDYMDYFAEKHKMIPINFSHYYHFDVSLHEKYADKFVLGFQPKQPEHPNLIWGSLYQLSDKLHVIFMTATDVRPSISNIYCTPVLASFGGYGLIDEWTKSNEDYIFEDIYDDKPERTGFFNN